MHFEEIKKVVCETVGDYGNDEFLGPNQNKGDILTVIWQGNIRGVMSYIFKETGEDFAYSAWRYKDYESENKN